MRTVGLVFTPKKISSSGFVGLENSARQHDLSIVFIDLAQSLEEQGPFNIIVHKMTDVVAKMKKGNPEACKQYDRFTQYCSTHPNVVILDQWSSIEKVLDRAIIYEHLLAVKATLSSADPLYDVPPSIVLPSLKTLPDTENIQFPVICKRLVACSSVESHMMTLIPSQQSMNQLNQLYDANEPLLLQKFVQHDGVLIKTYVLDDQIHVSARPSFKNMHSFTTTSPLTVSITDALHFDSQNLPKQFNTANNLPSEVDRVFLVQDPHDIHHQKLATLDQSRLQRIAHALQSRLGLTFFGFDVVVATGTDDYYVVDVNYFPSFNHVPNFHQAFINIVIKRLEQH